MVAWRRKRRAISKLFNYDLIKANIPEICSIVDKNLDKFESTHKTSENTYEYYLIEFGTATFMNVMMKCFFGGEAID